MPGTSPSPRAIERAVSVAQQLISTLPDDTDHQLLLDSLEGETDVMEVLDRIIEQSIADNKLADAARERAKRIEARAERSRSLALRILEALEVPSLERPLYTATIAYTQGGIVTNADELPPEYLRHTVDMRLLTKALLAGNKIEGAELKNPAPSLRVTTV